MSFYVYPLRVGHAPRSIPRVRRVPLFEDEEYRELIVDVYDDSEFPLLGTRSESDNDINGKSRDLMARSDGTK
ncbi:hypothetical protein DICVIV_11612 [Dictyocaulus viviparus]|uniref:Uncharacterized protein n=1 Tax=Dictyocaulus viviparus TaxID=29172 RepID=A0A0D8XCQ1_DICVI|nr:hypothetical protein DICVIV_11612 [Dictyocaulus viviparus]